MTRLRYGLLAALLTLAGCGPPHKPKPKPTEDAPPTVDDRNTNYRPDQGTLRNVLRSGQRGAAMNDFDQLKVFIFDFELNNSRMPTKEETRQELKQAGNLLKKVDDGVIVLTGTKDRQGLWAYEIDSEKAGGIVLTGAGVSRATADEVKQYLGQK